MSEPTVTESAASVRDALSAASEGLIDRNALIELIALCAVAREHLLVVGPPGTAKSEAVRRVSRAFGGTYFEYLLGRFTEPSEIFGPVDLRKLKDGIVETETSGMLPEAEVAFLDEVFLGSTAILNTLLGILNERSFRRGHTRLQCPLRVCVGATNNLPEDPTLAAFADRFVARMFVEPISDPLLEDLLHGGWTAESPTLEPIGLDHLDRLATHARAAVLDDVRPQIAQAVRLLRQEGIHLSDRRAVKIQKLVSAAAVLAGRERPSAKDLWPIVYAVPTPTEQRLARNTLRNLLEASENDALPAATEEASMGPAARATRIAKAGAGLFDTKPDAPEEIEQWQLKLEGIAREIDAGFSAETMPEELGALRKRIADEISEEAS